MRVVHVSDRLSERGGADRLLLSVIEALDGEVEQVLAVGKDDGTAAAPCRVVTAPGLATARRAAVAGDLDRIAGELRPDVIHVHNALNPEALAWAADRGAVMTVQDHRAFCPGRGKLTLAGAPCAEPMARATCAGCFEDAAYFERILALTRARLTSVQRMAALVVLSRYMAGELAGAEVPAARVHVIPPFVAGLSTAAAPDGPPCVAFVGRLVDAKGVFDAAEAHRLSGIDLPLVYAGTGSARSRLEALGHEVLGWVPHRRISSLYARARAVIVPSRWQEPFGLVGLEALAFGVPVVAYDSGGIRAWHPGPGLVPWGDVRALARALADAIARREPPPSGFTREAAAGALLALYRDAAGS